MHCDQEKWTRQRSVDANNRTCLSFHNLSADKQSHSHSKLRISTGHPPHRCWWHMFRAACFLSLWGHPSAPAQFSPCLHRSVEWLRQWLSPVPWSGKPQVPESMEAQKQVKATLNTFRVECWPPSPASILDNDLFYSNLCFFSTFWAFLTFHTLSCSSVSWSRLSVISFGTVESFPSASFFCKEKFPSDPSRPFSFFFTEE